MKKINIEIAADELSLLKQNQYALCLACCEKNTGCDVIGYAAMDYMAANIIEIGEAYQIFCCKSIKNHEKIFLSAGPVDIALGEQVRIDSSGIFSAPVTGKDPEAICLINECGNLYPGYSRKISFNGGTENFLPVFVAPYVSIKGSYSFNPQDKARIWFEQFAEIGTFSMDYLNPSLSKAGRSGAIEVPLTDDVVRLLYKNAAWKKM